jgi:hypothetical protein
MLSKIFSLHYQTVSLRIQKGMIAANTLYLFTRNHQLLEGECGVGF